MHSCLPTSRLLYALHSTLPAVCAPLYSPPCMHSTLHSPAVCTSLCTRLLYALHSALPLHSSPSISVLNHLDAQAMALEEIRHLPNPPSLVHMAVIEGALEMIPMQEYSRPPSNTGWLEKQEIFLRDDLLNQMTMFNPQHARAMSSQVRCQSVVKSACMRATVYVCAWYLSVVAGCGMELELQEPCGAAGTYPTLPYTCLLVPHCTVSASSTIQSLADPLRH